MIDEEEQNITVLRKRRRNSPKGAPNGQPNGHAHKEKSQSDWGWTRSAENPFAGGDPESRQRDSGPQSNEPERPRLSFQGRSAPAPEAPKDAIKLPFDPWRLLDAVKRRWYWLLIGMLVLGGLGFYAGTKLARYKVSVSLIRRQVDSAMFSNTQDPNRPAPLSDQTLFAFMRSGEVLRRVAHRAATSSPPIQVTAAELSKSVSVMPTGNPDILILSISSDKNNPWLADLANIYADEVVRYTRDIQASESGDVAKSLGEKVAIADKELAEAQAEFQAFKKEAGMSVALENESEAAYRQITDYQTKWETARIEADLYRQLSSGAEKILATQTPGNDRLKAAEEELEIMRADKTEFHPDVIRQMEKIKILKRAEASGTNSASVSLSANTAAGAFQMQKIDYQAKEASAKRQMEEYERLKAEARTKLTGLSEKSIRYAELLSKTKTLESTRQLLVQKERDTKLFVDNAMGFYRVAGQASSGDVNWKNRAVKLGAVTAMGAAMGLVGAILLAFFCEATDTRLKTAADIERTTKLPVLATLGDLGKMSPTEQINWAFRTLTILRGKLCPNPDDALVCGFISSQHGEGRSTWVNLLVSAASQRGLRVLTVDTRPTAEGPKTEPRPPQYPAGAPKATKNAPPQKSKEQNAEETAAANDLLAKPMAVAERLKDPESIVHIPIPGWVWSLDRRQQWQEALAAWRDIDNTVILIELPPACCPEAILLAEKIPQLIWLTGSGMADVKDTREQLETLKHAHCNVVGAALNFEPPPPMNTRLGRWFNWATGMILVGIGLCGSVEAQENRAFSASAQPKRAQWQQKLTLGPGDAMDISMFGQPTLTRTNIFVGPDGRISYLQAQGILAKGLTIEELRDVLDKELAKYYNTPRSIVIPTAFTSKKYYVLGKVVSKGVYSLDRPMTVLEAVARAQGLETGLYDRNTVEMADLSRSFLIRNGTREKVDLEKLFLEGDLAQNIAIEPDDFLFFGAAGAREIYVLGEVMNPGPIGFVSDATLLTAITDRGGFSSRAYQGKVLVVRGSLNKPETFVVDAKAILNAASPDFKLESRDIIYVGHRPWIRAEELLDEATQSFIQGFVTAFTGIRVGPFIKNPVFGN